MQTVSLSLFPSRSEQEKLVYEIGGGENLRLFVRMPCPSCPEQEGLFYEIGGKWEKRFIYILCAIYF